MHLPFFLLPSLIARFFLGFGEATSGDGWQFGAPVEVERTSPGAPYNHVTNSYKKGIALPLCKLFV
jgi:hypothetical protein